jgi:hypothetical protein
VEEERRRLGVEIGPGRQRLTLGRTASEGSGPESGRMVAGEGSESERTAAGARCWGGFGSARVGTGEGIGFLFFFTLLNYDLINHFVLDFLLLFTKWLRHIVTIINKKIFHMFPKK